MAAIGDGLALIAFVLAERRSANPMMPLSMFASRQFSAANAVTFVVFGALSGVFFLLVAFLQISLGYSPLAADAASLPITALMLLLSPAAESTCPTDRADTVDRRAAGHGSRTAVDVADRSQATATCPACSPAVIVFGFGLTLVVAPVTATVMAAADERHSASPRESTPPFPVSPV